MHARNATVTKVRGSEREVRRLLLGLQRPHVLETEPLAHVLTEVYGLDRPYDAVLKLIDDTFLDKGLIGRRLLALITHCDLEGNTQPASAEALNLSMRQFFRYRSEAVKALVVQVARLIAKSVPPTSAIEQLAALLGDVDPQSASRLYSIVPSTSEPRRRIEAALAAGDDVTDALLEHSDVTQRSLALLSVARFCFSGGARDTGRHILESVRETTELTPLAERARLEFYQTLTEYSEAAHYADATTCDQLSRKLRSAARADERLTCIALLVEVETALRNGEVFKAQETCAIAERMIVPRKQLGLLGALSQYKAKIAFMRGDLESAETYVLGAMLAFRQRPLDLIGSEALNGRIKIQMGRPWRASPQLLDHSASADVAITLPGARGVARLSRSEVANFEGLELEAVHLRSTLSSHYSFDEDVVAKYISRCERAGFVSLCASGHAIFARLKEHSSEPSEAQSQYLAAWSAYCAVRDELLGRDLIMFDSVPRRDVGPIVVDDAFLEILQQLVSRRFPLSILAVLGRSKVTDRFWKAALRSAYLRGEYEELRDAQHALSAFIQQRNERSTISSHRAAFVQELTRRLAILVPVQLRGGFAESLMQILETMSYA